jgi:integrase
MKTGFTDPYVKNLKAPGRYTDLAVTGLNLNIKQGGGKYWVFRYLLAGRRRDLSLGVYPEVSLKEARNRAIACRNNLICGNKPVTYWRNAMPTVTEKPVFRDYARECIESKKAEWKNDKHTYQWFRTIEVFANPVIGSKHLDEIDTDDILRILSQLWYSKTATANRLRGRLEWILASAITRGLRSGSNPATWRMHLETLLPKPSKISKVIHHPALPYKEIPEFMRGLRENGCMSALALEFLILNANRTGEVLFALRSEITDGAIWVIPGERMKVGKEHRIPLGVRSLEILQVAESLDPNSPYLFSIDGKPLSNMAMLMYLRGRHSSLTVHGFRSAFRDWVSEETSHSSEVAEKALAHTISNQTEAAYRRGDLLEPRRKLMKDWEDYCCTGSWGNVSLLSIDKRAA